MAGSQFRSPPFPRSDSLSKQRLFPATSEYNSTYTCDKCEDEQIDYVPGEPGVGLSQSTVSEFLNSELSTPLLDELYSHLWLVARRSGHSIDPLNRQRVRAREIVATEDAHLHLVWRPSIIYIKPMPTCLLNYDFWATYLSESAHEDFADHSLSQNENALPAADRRMVLGFMRSYALLVRHRVDFKLACKADLLPDGITWDEWSKFIVHFRNIEDEDVSNRFHYGQLRLSRLNWAVRLLRPSSAHTTWFYEIPHWSIGEFMRQSLAPLLFGFTGLSLVLSSMQVLVSVPEETLHLGGLSEFSIVALSRVCWIFSIMVLLLSGWVWLLMFTIPTAVLSNQLLWGFMNRKKPSRERGVEAKTAIAGKV
jgi:hypothetical protein